MRALKASLAYFALVFGVGFVLGAVRVMIVLPRLGIRSAELVELPFMLLASYLAARFTISEFGPFVAKHRTAIGLAALALLLAAELGLTLATGQSIGAYIASRDPVSGSAYLASLLLFALMPLLVGHGTGSSNFRKPTPLRGVGKGR